MPSGIAEKSLKPHVSEATRKPTRKEALRRLDVGAGKRGKHNKRPDKRASPVGASFKRL